MPSDKGKFEMARFIGQEAGYKLAIDIADLIDFVDASVSQDEVAEETKRTMMSIIETRLGESPELTQQAMHEQYIDAMMRAPLEK